MTHVNEPSRLKMNYLFKKKQKKHYLSTLLLYVIYYALFTICDVKIGELSSIHG